MLLLQAALRSTWYDIALFLRVVAQENGSDAPSDDKLMAVFQQQRNLEHDAVAQIQARTPPSRPCVF